jgi:hypothetical protein
MLEVFFELNYTSSSRFIIMTPMVVELSALVFFTMGYMNVTVFHHQKRVP